MTNQLWIAGRVASALLIGLLLPLGAQAEDRETQGMKTIEGSVWYRERMALPPTAEVQITLEDVARADAPSARIASTSVKPEGGPPFAFSLAYDPARLNDRGRYALRARIESEGRLLFISTEHIPAFDRAQPVEIVVSRVRASRSEDPSSAVKPDASLTDTYWKLTELDGQPASLGARGRELHLVMNGQESGVRGFSGCNQFTGSYERDDARLRFGPLVATRMACIDGMDQEQRFLAALASAMRFTISGDGLALYSGDERLTLRFEAVYLQ